MKDRPPNEYGPWERGNTGEGIGRTVTRWVRAILLTKDLEWIPVVDWEPFSIPSPKSGSVCDADRTALRDAQCTDAEIVAHLFLHSRGKCPLDGNPDTWAEYGQLIAGTKERL